MGAPSLKWRSVPWQISPQLEPWQKSCLKDLRSRAPSAKDVIWILSSGTQSVRSVKAIALTFENLECSARAVNKHLKSTKKDRWLRAIPYYHVGGLSIYVRAELSGAKVFEFSGWNPKRFSQALTAQKITLTSLVPTQVFDLVSAKIQAPSHLRAAVIGGGALSPELYAKARALGWPVLPSYGLTECCSQVATAPLDSLDGSGYPKLEILSHVEVKLKDQRIAIRSDALCRWVATSNEEGQFSLENPLKRGWLYTEDLAEKNKNFLKILGRRDDVVKILGALVPVTEVENELRILLDDQVCVLALNGGREGNDLIVVTDTRGSLRELEKKIADFNKTASGPRRVKQLVWVPKIPKNEMGKIKKGELRELLG